jgi:uncharacterized membrane protein YfcA
MKLALFVGLGLFTVLYLAVLVGAVHRRVRSVREIGEVGDAAGNPVAPSLFEVALGFVTAFCMTPTAAFPIRMGSCAFLMPVGSIKFVRSGRYSLRTALGLALGGVPAVLIAALVVKSLPLTALRWLVVVVVLYAAASMLRSAVVEARKSPELAPPPEAALAE